MAVIAGSFAFEEAFCLEVKDCRRRSMDGLRRWVVCHLLRREIEVAGCESSAVVEMVDRRSG